MAYRHEQHQGKISISSKEAKGTVVEITIPKQPAAQPPSSEDNEENKENETENLKRPRTQIAQYRVRRC